MKQLLIVEDDRNIAELERDYLEADGFAVTIAATGPEGLEKALTGGYDLILLDVMLPGMDGFAICRRIRETLDTPILMVSARQEDIDKIRGLGLGADDYIAKPFSPAELVARVKAHLARYARLTDGAKSTAAHRLSYPGLEIDLDAHRVYARGEEISLANKEYELLAFLAANPNILFSKEALFDRIWGMDSMGDTATVTVHINRIREKIEPDPAKPQCIETVWGAGYRFYGKT